MERFCDEMAEEDRFVEGDRVCLYVNRREARLVSYEYGNEHEESRSDPFVLFDAFFEVDPSRAASARAAGVPSYHARVVGELSSEIPPEEGLEVRYSALGLPDAFFLAESREEIRSSPMAWFTEGKVYVPKPES